MFQKKKTRFNIISLSKFINSNDTYTFNHKDGLACLTCNGVHENVEQLLEKVNLSKSTKNYIE